EQSAAKPWRKAHLWVESSQVLRGSWALQSSSFAHSAPVTHMFGPNIVEPSSFVGTHFCPILHSESAVHWGVALEPQEQAEIGRPRSASATSVIRIRMG